MSRETSSAMDSSSSSHSLPSRLSSAGLCIRYHCQATVLNDRRVARLHRRIVDEVPVDTATPVISAHFLIVAKTQTHHPCTIAVISNEWRFTEDSQCRIESKRELAKHSGIAACRCEF